MKLGTVLEIHIIIIAGLVYTESENNPDHVATLIGIVSWMGACGYAEYPDVYGRVGYNPILNWIQVKTGNFELVIR